MVISLSPLSDAGRPIPGRRFILTANAPTSGKRQSFSRLLLKLRVGTSRGTATEGADESHAATAFCARTKTTVARLACHRDVPSLAVR